METVQLGSWNLFCNIFGVSVISGKRSLVWDFPSHPTENELFSPLDALVKSLANLKQRWVAPGTRRKSDVSVTQFTAHLSSQKDVKIE